MSLSRLEINLRRLLNKCELMVKGKQKDNEKFPQYINSLDRMLEELQNISSSVSTQEMITEYNIRIINLKSILGLNVIDENNSRSQFNLDDTIGIGKNKLTPREELLGLRQRGGQQQANSNDLDELINYHENMQEKIADNMLILTRNLKEQSELANKIIKKDTEVVGRSTQLTEDNYEKLKVESNKLSEHSKRAWKCWMWIMLAVVLIVFINMILFMKVMKKT